MKNTLSLLKVVVALIVVPTLTNSAIAADLGEIVIQATQDSAKAESSSQNVTIISTDKIAQTHSLSELLATEAQVDISQLGSPGEDINIRMRGSDKDEVILLLNGLPTNDSLDARATLLESLPLNIIDHIEILRGPQSVLYGSNAVGGIINIVTKKSGNNKEVTIQSGTHQTFVESLYLSQEFGKHAGSASFERADSKGRFSNDRYGKNTAFASHTYQGNKSSIQSTFLYSGTSQNLATETLVGGTIPVPIYNVRDSDRQLNRTYFIPQTNWTWSPNNWYQSVLHYGLVWQNISLDNSSSIETFLIAGTVRGSQRFRSSAQKHRINWQNHFTALESDSLRVKILVGGDLSVEKLSYQDGPTPSDNTGLANINYPDATLGQKGTRKNYSGYFQNVTELWNKLFISLGARYDKNSTYGYSISPRLSASYIHTPTKTKFFSGISQGFKAPTINEYYLTLTDATGLQLRQRLATEKSHSMDIGFENRLIPKTKIGLAYFNTRYKNLIDDLALIPRAEIQGIESWVSVAPLKWLLIDTNYSLTKANNTITNTPLTSRPIHHMNARLQIKPSSKLRITLSAQTTSSRRIPTTLSTEAFGDLPLSYLDISGNSYGQNLPRHTIVNASADYDIPLKSRTVKTITASIKATNLINKTYSDYPGFTSREFGLLGGLSFKF